MERFKPEKLHVEYRNVTPSEPIIGRKYTQTHSDLTVELFVTIGLQYAYDKISPNRDEVLAEWRILNNFEYYLLAYVYIGGFDYKLTEKRYMIFNRELPLALAAIRNGDNPFFKSHPELDKAPIYIYFDSTYPNFRGYRSFGTPSDYKNCYR